MRRRVDWWALVVIPFLVAALAWGMVRAWDIEDAIQQQRLDNWRAGK